MPRARRLAEHEERAVQTYVESQLRDDEDGVTLVERVEQRRVLGNNYQVFDVHTKKGRWWVIDNLRNLYDQGQFPNRGMALTFHIGLMVQMMDRDGQEDDEEHDYDEGAWRRYAQASEAMNDAIEAEDFQAVGVKCREALLAVARENADAEWLGEIKERPKGDDLGGWMTIFAERLLDNRRQRAYLRSVSSKAWDLAVGLQHDARATPWDAEIALEAVKHVLEIFMLARVKFDRGAPDRCPQCGSYRVDEDGEVETVGEVEGYRKWDVCAACGWQSESEFSPFL